MSKELSPVEMAAVDQLAEQSAAAFAKTPVLQVRLQLGVAAIHQYHLKDANAASKIYKTILEEEMANLMADRQLQPKSPRGQRGPRTAAPA